MTSPSTTIGPTPATDLIAPSQDPVSVRNAHMVLQAVAERFPDWAAQCKPYENVLTLQEWNDRGYYVKKGEKAIRVGTLIPVWKDDEKTGQKVPAGHRWHRAYVFALPQVYRSPYHRHYNDTGLPISAYPPVRP